MTVEASLRPRGPYSLSLSARAASDATRVFREGVLEAVVPGSAGPERVRAWQTLDGTVQILAASREGVERTRFVLALDPCGGSRRRDAVQALEVERAAEPDERRSAARVQPELSQPRRRLRRQRARGRRSGEPIEAPRRRAHDPALDLPRARRLDQLAAESAQQREGDGRHAKRTQPAEMPGDFAQQRIPPEAPQEFSTLRQLA